MEQDTPRRILQLAQETEAHDDPLRYCGPAIRRSPEEIEDAIRFLQQKYDNLRDLGAFLEEDLEPGEKPLEAGVLPGWHTHPKGILRGLYSVPPSRVKVRRTSGDTFL
jgi:hypothetical protein